MYILYLDLYVGYSSDSVEDQPLLDDWHLRDLKTLNGLIVNLIFEGIK